VTASLEAVVGRPVSRETVARLKEYEAMVREESLAQNLVSKATLDEFWHRHVIDSAQLVGLSEGFGGRWADIGSGAGLPGVVIACLVEGPMTLIEPRRLRADFLRTVVDRLGLPAQVVQKKAERVSGTYDVLTARAVAGLGQLLDISYHLSTGKSLYLFPKGKSAQSELLAIRQTWQGSFHVEQSVTDADSYIIVARDVRPRTR